MVTVAEHERDQHGHENDWQDDDVRRAEDTRVRDSGDEASCSYNVTLSEDEEFDPEKRRVCLHSDSPVEIPDEDGSRSSSTQSSDIDGVEGEDGWIAEPGERGASVYQEFDNGVALPNSEAPSFGDVCVKNSANVHFGNKTFYNGPVTIKQFVYANPALASDEGTADPTSGENFTEEKKSPYANTFSAQGKTSTGKPDLPYTRDDYKGRCSWTLTWRCVALICTLGSCLVAAVVVSVVFLSRDSEIPLIPFNTDPSLSPTVPDIPNVRIITRDEWGAQPASEPYTNLTLPVPYVIISHTATAFCGTQSECTFRVRFAQTFHIESRKWSDIAYNFLIGGDGYAYVGRGWDYVGAHSFGYNNVSIGISFIGTFNSVKPPEAQLAAAKKLINAGVGLGKIAPNYKLLGHRQVSATLSPGDTLYNIINRWDHWSPQP